LGTIHFSDNKTLLQKEIVSSLSIDFEKKKIMAIPSRNVYVAQMDTPRYGESNETVLPEFANDAPITKAPMLLHRLFKDAGLDSAHSGSAKWNSLGDIIGDGLKVFLKPNWVLDEKNSSSQPKVLDIPF
jgi:hypothetical protein